MAQHIISVLAHILPSEQSWKIKILQDWAAILGPLAHKVVLQRIDDTAVVLAVAHPSLAQELLLLSDLIREKINTAIGEPRIIKITFRAQGYRPTNTSPHKKQSPTQVPHRKPLLSPAETAHLNTINNKELRDALAAFYGTCKERTTT